MITTPTVYPFHIQPDSPIDISLINKTYVTSLETGQEFRRTNWVRPKRKITLKYSFISDEGIYELWQFYNAAKGKLEDFIYQYPALVQWTNEYLGLGTGSACYFELPFKFSTVVSFTVYANGSSVGGYSFIQNGYNFDQLYFPTTIAGAAYTCSFTGKPYLKMRFADDTLDFTQFKASLHSVGIELVEVLD